MADAQHDLRIALLGPLLVEVGHAEIDIPEGHQRRLLAALALSADQTVSTDRLIDLLWGDDPPVAARNSLQSHLTRLRHNLGGPGTIVREAGGYRLDGVDGVDAVDVGRFDRLVGDATHTADPSERRRLLDQALELWRADEPSALTVSGLYEDARRLLNRRNAALLDRASTTLALGDTAGAERDALTLLRTDPLHEPAVVVLVRVLAAAGRAAEADAAFQRFRGRLADELGIDPSPALEQVHTALLRGELEQVPAPAPSPISSGPGRAAEPTPAPSSMPGLAPPTSPVLPRSSFRGRQQDIDELATAVESDRCVTVVGPGGVGKTRLALELAHRQRREVVWADLLEARTRGDVLDRLAVAAGCGTPTDLRTLTPLAEALTTHEALVVLDNCEQAVAEVAAVVETLLHATLGTTVLATSRTPLAVNGERVFALAPLPTHSKGDDPPPALSLFADRMGREIDLVDPDRRRVAAEVVVALDGLPLALELAARQARNLGLVAVRDRLDDRLDLLDAPRPGDHPAHSDLRNLVRWSTDQLDEPERRAFRWLSVFSGPFTLAHAEHLLSPDGAKRPAAAASVGRLVEQSLLTRPSHDRFLLLETLRACGAEALEDTGEAIAATARHTEVVLTAVEAASATLGTSADVQTVAALNALVADLQVVTDRLVAQSEVEGLSRLARAVRQYAYETQRPELLRSARVAHDLLLTEEAGPSVRSELRDGAVVAAAVDATTRGDLERAASLVEPVMAAGRTTAATAVAWSVAGDVRLWRAEASAEACYRKAIELSEVTGEELLAATGWVGVALAHAYAGQVEGARPAVEEIDRRAARLGSPLVSAWAAYARAETEANHNPEDALAAFELAIERGRAVGGHLVVAAASSGAAAVRARHGDPAVVLHHIRHTLRELRRRGSPQVQDNVLRNVGVLLTRMGSDEAAAVLLGATTPAALYDAERRRVAMATASIAERLGVQAAGRLRAEGARMDPAELLGVALSAVEDLTDA